MFWKKCYVVFGKSCIHAYKYITIYSLNWFGCSFVFVTYVVFYFLFGFLSFCDRSTDVKHVTYGIACEVCASASVRGWPLVCSVAIFHCHSLHVSLISYVCVE